MASQEEKPAHKVAAVRQSAIGNLQQRKRKLSTAKQRMVSIKGKRQSS